MRASAGTSAISAEVLGEGAYEFEMVRQIVAMDSMDSAADLFRRSGEPLYFKTHVA
jgi:hypothetical protein